MLTTIPVLLELENQYVMEQKFVLEIHDLSSLSRTILDLLRRGVGEIETVEYRSSQLKALKSKAMIQALGNAKLKASKLAEELNQKLGDVYFYKELEVINVNSYGVVQSDVNQLLFAENYVFNEGYISVPYKVEVSFDLSKE